MQLAMEESFPRGRRKYDTVEAAAAKVSDNKTKKVLTSSSQPSEQDKKKTKKNKTNEQDGSNTKKRDVSDFLFGGNSADAAKDAKSSGRKRRKGAKNNADDDDDGGDLVVGDIDYTSKELHRNSLLPLGGGAVVVLSGKHSSIEGGPQRLIESLHFSKLHPGLQLLSVVREVHDDLAVFSLPNHWTGFMLRTPSTSCSAMVREGQVMSVTIVKAEQETSGKSVPRRRIQVTCLPDKVNVGLSLQESPTPKMFVRGQIKTIEDHGLLIDLGFQQRGFLSFDDIHGEYRLIEDGDQEEMDDEQESDDEQKNVEHILGLGRVLDFLVKKSAFKGRGGSRADGEHAITSLMLPSHKERVQLQATASDLPSLHSLQPGTLVQCTVEALAKNGLCVCFAHGAYRGAIETQHLGSFFLPKSRSESDEWQKIFDKNRAVLARIIAVDTSTKIIRLSLAVHILNLSLPHKPPAVGTLFPGATVIRCDAGVGALLALSTSKEDEDEVNQPKSYFPPVCTVDSYLNGQRIKVAYVHISKAIDGYDKNKEGFESSFAKEFAPSTKHDVRILGNSNLVEGFATGATAASIVGAHVFSYNDLTPGQVHKQVPICSNLDNGGVVVDFGNGIRGLIPSMHLFDQSSKNEYRSRMQKVKYAVNAKVDVRVLKVDADKKKCIVTAKKSLVQTKHVLKSFEEMKVGQLGTGFVSKVGDRGTHVTFFDGVFGFVPNKNLREQALEGTYSAGDVIQCRIKQIKRLGSSSWNVTLAASPSSGRDYDDDDEDYTNSVLFEEQTLDIGAGRVLPEKCLRVVDLKDSRQKHGKLLPGFAIVETKTKHMTNSFTRGMPDLIECKLPYDQLLDEYDPHVIDSPTALDIFAQNHLAIGESIKSKAIVMSDPQKTISEHRSGTGKLPALSLRKKLIQTAESQDQTTILLPKPDSHLFAGAAVQGYVAHVDPRHGAFVRFLDGMTGLVPKKESSGLALFSTVQVSIFAVDVTAVPPRVLLSTKEKGTPKLEKYKDMLKPSVGDTIEAVVVEKLSFHLADVRILDDKFIENKAIAATIHPTVAPVNIHGLEDIMDSTNEFDSDHPFYRWRPGLEISKLKVMSVELLGTGIVKVGLCSSDCEGMGFENAVVEEGKFVTGIVSSVPQNGTGIWVMLGPSLMGFIPSLEASDNLEVVQNLESNFPSGKKLSAQVIGRRHVKFRKNEGKDVVLLTLLKERRDLLPKGSIVLGRVNRWKKVAGGSPPHLILDLPGGKTGRCCITELADPDDWSSFPFGDPSRRRREKKRRGKRRKKDDKREQDSDENSTDGSDDEEEKVHSETSGEDGLFPNGKLVRCCVLCSDCSVIQLSCRKSRLEGDLEDDPVPKVGDKTPAYVVGTNGKGCFLRISRHVEGRVVLKNLSVSYVTDPSATFPRGRLVLGKVTGVKGAEKSGGKTFLDIDLKEFDAAENEAILSFDDIQVGDKFKATITRLAEYGVFVRLEKSNVTGLVHKSECSERYLEDVSSVYNLGDLVKVLVIRKDEEGRKLAFSMKSSHFVNDDGSEDDKEKSTYDSEPDSDNLDAGETSERKSIDSAKLLPVTPMDVDANDEVNDEDDTVEEANADRDKNQDVEESSSSDESDKDGNHPDGVGLDTNIGFDWGGGATAGLAKDGGDDDSSSDGDCEDFDEDDNGGSEERVSRRSKKTQALRRREEATTAQREAALADGTADENPETSADFERLLASDPNSSELWIRFMAFHLTLADIAAARQVAEKAFARIEFREERDKMNVWCALLTLEVKYGSEETVEKALARASQQVNPKHIHLRLCEILEKEGSASALDRIDKLCSKMCKKFRTKKAVWLYYAKFLLSNEKYEEAVALSKRALLSLPKYKHIWFMSHFGQHLFESGRSEQARAVFEALLRQNPKRADLLTLYIDQEVKHGEIPEFRKFCERVANTSHPDRIMKLSDKQMKNFFKRWFTVEENHGSDTDREAVKTAARRFIEGARS